MKTRRTIAIACILILICVFLLAACAKESEAIEDNAEDTILGEWASVNFDGAFVYTFLEDGTGSYDAMGTYMPFTYTAADGKLIILYDGDDYAFETTYTVTADMLTVKDSLNEDIAYIRK